MASLRKLPDSRNWIACFTDANGRRLQRSTGTHVRQKALAIAFEFEAVARQRKTEAQIRRVMSDLYEKVSGVPLPSGSVRNFLESWVRRKNLENADRTARKYADAVTSFLRHLGSKADLDLGYLTPADVVSFRDALLGRVSVSTSNLTLKIIRIALNQARREGLTQSNPAAQVSNLRNKEGEGSRRAFTMEEVSRLIVTAEDSEWRGIIAIGLYTGQRLGDIATLCWANVNLELGEIRLVTKKTGRKAIIRIAPPLQSWFETQKRGNAGEPVFPDAFQVVQRTGRTAGLSNRFYEIMVKAGLAGKRTHQANEHRSGRSGRRQKNELSFHSLRHTTTSLLKNLGVPVSVAMEFVGHQSAAISQHYTHVDLNALDEAAKKLPDLFQSTQ